MCLIKTVHKSGASSLAAGLGYGLTLVVAIFYKLNNSNMPIELAKTVVFPIMTSICIILLNVIVIKSLVGKEYGGYRLALIKVNRKH